MFNPIYEVAGWWVCHRCGAHNTDPCPPLWTAGEARAHWAEKHPQEHLPRMSAVLTRTEREGNE